MKVIKLPEKIKALIFDMDLTLYTSPEYGQVQIKNLITVAGNERGLSYEEANSEIEALRKSYAASHNGKIQSLSSIFLSWGFTMEENINWRKTSYEPEKYLTKDEKLRETLLALSHYKLGVITNNPVLIAERTLASLGIEDLFSALIGLDTLKIAKPHRLPFVRIMELFNDHNENAPEERIDIESAVSIGDRFEVDLEIPLEMGMGAILVDGVEDVYCLPEILRKNNGQ